MVRTMNGLILAARNVRRKPFQSVVIAGALAFASAIVLAGVLIALAVEHSLDVATARLGADLIVVPKEQNAAIETALLTGEPTIFYMPASFADTIAQIPGVAQSSPQLFVESLSNAACCSGRFFLVGFDPETDFTVTPWIRQTLGERVLAPTEIIIGHDITLEMGGQAKFFGTEFHVVGVLDKTGMGLDRTVFIPAAGLRQMIRDSVTSAVTPLRVRADKISAVLVKAEAGTDPRDLAKAIGAALGEVNVVLQIDFVRSVSQRFRSMSALTAWMALAIWILALPLIGTIFSMVINARKKEIALLRAMGARRGFVFRCILFECLFLCLLGSLLGSTAGAWITYNFRALVSTSLQVPFLWPEVPVLLALVGCMLLGAACAGCLAGLLPAIRNSRRDPHDVLRVVV